MVDCAQGRVARFDPRTGLTRLITQRVSQASMTQRAGRAGRLEPGICLHLIAKEQAERAARVNGDTSSDRRFCCDESKWDAAIQRR
ncbi:hypothetical protein DJICPGNB_23660 [Escherichia coli]|nr:hypothetical protein DJICPGNB_23660 [Escherichia coli]